MSGEKIETSNNNQSADMMSSELDGLTRALADQVSELMSERPDVSKMARVGNKVEQVALKPVWEKMDSPERLFREAAVCTLSAQQVRDGLEGKEYLIRQSAEDGSCQDAAYGNGEQNVFAVFDGVGGEPGGREASHACVDNLSRIMSETGFTTSSEKRKVIDKLCNSVEVGGTTAVIAKIVAEGSVKKLHYASVGDSRLYIVHGFMGSEQITKDDAYSEEYVYRKFNGFKSMEAIKKLKAEALEGRMSENRVDCEAQDMMVHYISNCIKSGERGRINAGNCGVVRLHRGDTIVLCTDGITGDIKKDIRTKAEIARAVRHESAQDAVINLMECATKNDDRAAIVVKV